MKPYLPDKMGVWKLYRYVLPMSTRNPLSLARTVQFPKVSLKRHGRVLAPILDRMTIWNVALGAMILGASFTMALTVSMPALTGGFESTQLNTESSTGSYKKP